MLDLSYVRSNLDRVAERLATRSGTPYLEPFRELDQKRRSVVTQSERLKAQVNELSVETGRLKREGADTTALQEQVRSKKSEMASLDEQVKALDSEFRDLLSGIPNIPHESVPVGKTEADKVEIRRVGQIGR